MERLEAGRSHISIYRRSGRVLQRAQHKSRLTEPGSGSTAAGTRHQPDACHWSQCRTRGGSESDKSSRSQYKCNKIQFSQRIKDGPRSKPGGGCLPVPEVKPSPGQPGDSSPALILSPEHHQRTAENHCGSTINTRDIPLITAQLQGHHHQGIMDRPYFHTRPDLSCFYDQSLQNELLR